MFLLFLGSLLDDDGSIPTFDKNVSFFGEDCCLKKIRTRLDLLSIPQSEGKNVRTFGWDHKLQIQTLFMAFKTIPL